METILWFQDHLNVELREFDEKYTRRTQAANSLGVRLLFEEIAELVEEEAPIDVSGDIRLLLTMFYRGHPSDMMFKLLMISFSSISDFHFYLFGKFLKTSLTSLTYIIYCWI